jgi:hypothetical protein
MRYFPLFGYYVFIFALVRCITYVKYMISIGYRILLGRPEENKPLWRPRRKWEDNIKMCLQDVGRGHGLDWTGSGQGQVSDFCECGNESAGSIKHREILDSMKLVTAWLVFRNSRKFITQIKVGCRHVSLTVRRLQNRFDFTCARSADCQWE